MRFEEVVETIINTPRFADKKGELNKSGNDNLKGIMSRLGNPHLSIPAIHIAGTNGKGSTCQFIKNILNKKGYTVGVFTSPHLVKINERIEISYGKEESKSELISDEDFIYCYETLKKQIDAHGAEGGLHLSFFEIMFALAAVYFQMKKPDYVIYETGLGGRLDATNILEPVICGITSIGLDHTKYLGDTIKAVAGEKAGIIKADVPVVYNTGDAQADEVIEERANILGTRAINVAKTDYIIFDLTDKIIDFSLVNSYYRYDNIKLKVTGATYQVDNAITAIVLCNTLLGIIDKDTLQSALDDFFWPGRMEKIHPNVILDGAHNMDAIERFVEACDIGNKKEKSILLFAVAEDKDYKPMIEYICSELSFEQIIVTSIDSNRAVPAEYIADIFRLCLKKQGGHNLCNVIHNDDLKEAFNTGFKKAVSESGTLYCVGSLYLIGSIKEIAKEVLYD